jgi:uncharacterized protein (DUF427 family)
MSLTMATGPLAAGASKMVNYRIDAPEHRLFFDVFPRRVRAVFAGSTVVDTVHGMLLHETGELPQLYVSAIEIQGHLLTPSGHTTRCPFKGEARYYSIRVGDRFAEDAVWSYPEPPANARWLRGYQAIAFAAMDAWFDEDEQVYGHLRDPYHRVDARRTSRRIRVCVGRHLLAESNRPVLLSETGLPNRLYIPPDDVRPDALTSSPTTRVCPYKGTAEYASACGIADVAWRYPEPYPDAAPVAGYWCFDESKVTVEYDSHAAPSGQHQQRRVLPKWL